MLNYQRVDQNCLKRSNMIQGIVPNRSQSDCIQQWLSSMSPLKKTFGKTPSGKVLRIVVHFTFRHPRTPWHRSGGNCYDPVDVEGQKTGWPRIWNKTKGPRNGPEPPFEQQKWICAVAGFNPPRPLLINLAPTSNTIGGQIKRAACAWWCHTSSVVSGDDQRVTAVDSVPTSAAIFTHWNCAKEPKA